MPRRDRPANDTTARPTVPGPRQHAGEQGEAGRPDTRQPDAGQPDVTKAPSPARASAEHVLARTRLSGAWLAVACFLVLLVILLLFITQNDRVVDVTFFGTHNHVYLGVALVLAAVCGALLVMFAAMARIMQLRSRARRHRRMVQKAAGR